MEINSIGGWRFEYTPMEIIIEFSKRWDNIPKITFEQFYDSIYSIENRESGLSKYYESDKLIEIYQCYVAGDPNRRYPRLPIHPETILKEVLNDAIITFKNK